MRSSRAVQLDGPSSVAKQREYLVMTPTSERRIVEIVAEPERSYVGADPAQLILHVNGAPRALHVEPQMTLAEALRGPLGLPGTKIASDRGACSACTVWLDGAPVCACMLPASCRRSRSRRTGTAPCESRRGASHGSAHRRTHRARSRDARCSRRDAAREKRL
jgi:hypothetical protein